MPKIAHNDVFDYGLSVISSRVTRVAIVSTNAPSTMSSASSVAYAIAAAVSSHFVIADGDVSGRKITVAQFSTVPVRSTGVAGHVQLFSTGATGAIYYQTSCTTQALGSTANSVTIPSWKIEIADPT